MIKKELPRIHFYDQDFVDIYDKTWVWIQDCWKSGGEKKNTGSQDNPIQGKFFCYPNSMAVRQEDAIFASFFLVYSNRNFHAHPTLDIFYDRQEENGAIRSAYSIETSLPVFEADNPEGLGMPIFAWAEHNLYHKTANKKRIKEVIPKLQRYIEWINSVCMRDNGLYEAPFSAGGMINAPRENAVYPVDFNAMMAINVLYMSALTDLLNDKESSFQYKRRYFALKTQINALMWDEKTGFYYDIDANGDKLLVKTLAAYWTLLAEIPNEDKAEQLIDKLRAPEYFGTVHPFPSLSADESVFDENGGGYRGSVYPHLNFMVTKGLERYHRWGMARECAIRHIYFLLDTMSSDEGKSKLWEAYLPNNEGLARWEGHADFPRPQYLAYGALSTITVMIENVVGILISLPKKTVDWIIPNMDSMGVENLSLKKNLITIQSNKSGRGWEIHMESEKLYYFTINILDKKKKTLPIPSGKCSILIDKIKS